MEKDTVPNITNQTLLEKIMANIHYILPILPLLLVIWILYQFSFLIWINKTLFFSWSQVINDTSILILPLIFWVAWFLLVNEIDPLTKKGFWKDLLGLLLLVIVIYLVLYGVRIPKLLWQVFVLGAFSNLMLAIIIFIKVTYLWSEKMKNKNANDFMKLVWFILLFFALINLVRENQFSDLYIKTNGNIQKVEYMNDNYIFMSGSTIHNTEDIIFEYWAK